MLLLIHCVCATKNMIDVSEIERVRALFVPCQHPKLEAKELEEYMPAHLSIQQQSSCLPNIDDQHRKSAQTLDRCSAHL
jgi:hypothetical protein